MLPDLPNLPTLSLSKAFAALLNVAVKTQSASDTAPLEGRSFAIAIDELPQDIGITAVNGKIVAVDDADIPDVDVVVSGNLKAVLNMIQDEDTGLDSDELYIAGKISTAKHFQHFLASLRINWQGFFAQFMPDDKADKAAATVEQGLDFAKGSAEQLGERVKRFLIEEQKVVVCGAELDAFKDDIARFNQQLEQLSARLATIIRAKS